MWQTIRKISAWRTSWTNSASSDLIAAKERKKQYNSIGSYIVMSPTLLSFWSSALRLTSFAQDIRLASSSRWSTTMSERSESNGGEGEIRTRESFRIAGFQDQCLQPLGHLSKLWQHAYLLQGITNPSVSGCCRPARNLFCSPAPAAGHDPVPPPGLRECLLQVCSEERSFLRRSVPEIGKQTAPCCLVGHRSRVDRKHQPFDSLCSLRTLDLLRHLIGQRP